MVDEPDKMNKRMTVLKTQGEIYERETEMVYPRRKAGAKAKATVESGMSPAWEKKAARRKETLQSKGVETLIASSVEASVHVPEDKRKYGLQAAEGKATPVQTSGAETIPVAGIKGKTMPAMSDEYEAATGIITASTEGLFSLEETEIEEIIPDVTEGVFRCHEMVNQPVPTEAESEDWMKSELRINIHKLVEPLIAGADSNSSLSDKAMVRRKILQPSNMDELINEAKVDGHCLTPGGQALPEPVPNARISIHHNVHKILGYMKDVRASRIGIYGNGGIGKTTLLKALVNHPEIEDMFDLIIWVTVSRYSGEKEIQSQVVRQLSSCLADSEMNHETTLHALKSKKFLLILDDVWEWINLDAVGIPNPDQQNGSRIILTTRSLDVCRIMATDRDFELELISRKEAWELFHDQVGEIIDSEKIQPYAQAIVEECGGLPLTIVVTGRALRKETDVLVWKRALRELLLPSTLGIHGTEAVLKQLKFSYDKLKTRDIKSCFLYCALLPEDHEVNISELINYFICEGLVTGNSTDAHKNGCDIIEVLVEAAMLESTHDGLSVRMHYIVRELALGIISTEAEGCQFLLRAEPLSTQPPKSEFGNGSSTSQLQSPERTRSLFPKFNHFMLKAGAGLTEPPPPEEWEQAKMVFLMDNGFSNLPESPNCPNLKTLFLQRNHNLRVIPMSFFNYMPYLQVLNLSKTRIQSLPQSLSKLINLLVLVVRDCRRLAMLPSEIGTLTHLEVLDLQGTDIYNLPNEIRNLTCLKHLLVSFYGSVNHSEYVGLPPELVSHGIISRLVALEELHIFVYPGDKRWNREVQSVTEEVVNLTKLTALEFYFPDANLLELFIQTSPSGDGRGLTKLTKFNFIVGHNVKRIVSRVPVDVEFEYDQHNQCLRFVNGSKKLPHPAVLEVLNRSSAFYLDHHLHICSLSEFGIGNLNALKFCILRECPQIQIIMDGLKIDGRALPFLEHFSIHYLWNLRKIWEGTLPPGSFHRLKSLSIHTCPKLTFVLTCSMLQILSNLEVLVVDDCQEVKDILVEDRDTDVVINSGDIVLPKLKKLNLHYMPKLVSIWKGSWPSVEHISFYNCPNLKNLHMSFDLEHTIKEIKAEKDWWEALSWEDTALFMRLQAHFTPLCDDDL
ncbi:hypothetical protein F0562_030588 [Nyssa sinensis]|uniref:AAA+ ATPase domain-containing protein n=1 Tax=Nyssa sinensis TaxID=561372 RepID=A0A5J5B084_9ASTE|nr:hypothetical protein F0562_030588 [Nyssa sinensis]